MRKREVGILVLAKYFAFTKSKTFANILLGKLQEKKRQHPNFEFEILTAIVTNIATDMKYEKIHYYQIPIS